MRSLKNQLGMSMTLLALILAVLIGSFMTVAANYYYVFVNESQRLQRGVYAYQALHQFAVVAMEAKRQWDAADALGLGCPAGTTAAADANHQFCWPDNARCINNPFYDRTAGAYDRNLCVEVADVLEVMAKAPEQNLKDRFIAGKQVLQEVVTEAIPFFISRMLDSKAVAQGVGFESHIPVLGAVAALNHANTVDCTAAGPPAPCKVCPGPPTNTCLKLRICPHRDGCGAPRDGLWIYQTFLFL